MAFQRRNTDKKGSAARNAARRDGPDQGWIWGRHAVLAALANPKRKHISLHVTRNAATELDDTFQKLADIELPGQITARLPEGAVHQGFALKTGAPPAESLNAVMEPTHGLLVVLDQITDPHNVGAILRSCAAFGVRAVIVQDRNRRRFLAPCARPRSAARRPFPM